MCPTVWKTGGLSVGHKHSVAYKQDCCEHTCLQYNSRRSPYNAPWCTLHVSCCLQAAAHACRAHSHRHDGSSPCRAAAAAGAACRPHLLWVLQVVPAGCIGRCIRLRGEPVEHRTTPGHHTKQPTDCLRHKLPADVCSLILSSPTYPHTLRAACHHRCSNHNHARTQTSHMLTHTLHVTTVAATTHMHACTHTHTRPPPTHAHLLMRPSTRCQVGTSVLKIVSMLGIRLAL